MSYAELSPLFHCVGTVTEYSDINRSKSSPGDMYTMDMIKTKIYVCNSYRLLPLIQRAYKTLSFRPFMQHTARAFGDANVQTHHLFGGQMVDDLSLATKKALGPGPNLDLQNSRMGHRAIVDIDSLLAQAEQGLAKINLLEWTKHMVVQASSSGVFGEQHPFLDLEIEKAFWYVISSSIAARSLIS